MKSGFRLRRAQLVLLLLLWVLIAAQVPIRSWVEETPAVSLTLTESMGAAAAIPAASSASVPPAAALAAALHPAPASVPPSPRAGPLSVLRI